MSTKETLSIIIVTFNSENQIVKCISSILKSKLENFKYKINIIDNNSVDSTVNVVKNNFDKEIANKKICLILSKKNLGFATAVNKGIKEKKSDYYLLINPDIFVKETTIDTVLGCSKINKSHITGVITINENGNKTGSFFRFPNLMVGIFDFTNFRKLSINDYWHKYFYYLDKKNFKNQNSKIVDIVTGGFMLIKSEVIKGVGYFDQRFFMYLEDVDYCYRAKKAGYVIAVCNEEVVHLGGASSNNEDRINHLSWVISRKKYYFKHFNLIENFLIQLIFIIDDFIIGASYILKI